MLTYVFACSVSSVTNTWKWTSLSQSLRSFWNQNSKTRELWERNCDNGSQNKEAGNVCVKAPQL